MLICCDILSSRATKCSHAFYTTDRSYPIFSRIEQKLKYFFELDLSDSLDFAKLIYIISLTIDIYILLVYSIEN